MGENRHSGSDREINQDKRPAGQQDQQRQGQFERQRQNQQRQQSGLQDRSPSREPGQGREEARDRQR